MTIKYVMAKDSNHPLFIEGGCCYIAEWQADSKQYDLKEDCGRFPAAVFAKCSQAEYDGLFIEMTKADYETYFNACVNGYEDVWTLIRNKYLGN